MEFQNWKRFWGGHLVQAFILQMGKLSPREGKLLIQFYPANEWGRISVSVWSEAGT